MHNVRRLVLLIVIMVVISFMVVITSIYILYGATMEQNRQSLWELAKSQAIMIESIFQETLDPIKVLKIVYASNARTDGIGMTGEFTIVQLIPDKVRGDRINFLMNREKKGSFSYPYPVPFYDSNLAEPDRRALQGYFGTMIGMDYKGQQVLAAYRFIRGLNWGIVAKMDMDEIWAPFGNAVFIALITVLLLVMPGALLFIRITNPMIRKIAESEENYKKLFYQLSLSNEELQESQGKLALLNENLKKIVAEEVAKNLENEKVLSSHLRELEIGREIQMSILPACVPDVKGLSIAARYIPMELIGGDFYDFISAGEKQVGLFIADVSGHGIPAALIASMVKIAVSAQKHYAPFAGKVLKEINNTLPQNWDDNFLTAQYAWIDRDKMKISLSNAGHIPLVLFRKSEQKIYHYKPKGGIIGWFPDADFEEEEIGIQIGDRLIMYTDGLIEAINEKKEFYGKTAFYAFIQEHQDKKPEDFVNHILNHLKEWTGNGELEDDITMIVADVVEDDSLAVEFQAGS
jgi:serine phosphatase RsbU (regulator of sigma subunit)